MSDQPDLIRRMEAIRVICQPFLTGHDLAKGDQDILRALVYPELMQADAVKIVTMTVEQKAAIREMYRAFRLQEHG